MFRHGSPLRRLRQPPTVWRNRNCGGGAWRIVLREEQGRKSAETQDCRGVAAGSGTRESPQRATVLTCAELVPPVELGAIRIWPVVAANGRCRSFHRGRGYGDAARSHGVGLSKRFWIDCRSQDRQPHCQLVHTRAIEVVREQRNDGTCAPILSHDLLAVYKNRRCRQRARSNAPKAL